MFYSRFCSPDKNKRLKVAKAVKVVGNGHGDTVCSFRMTQQPHLGLETVRVKEES